MFNILNRVRTLIALMVVVAVLPLASVSAEETEFNPFEKSISEISDALDNNQIKSEQLVKYYLERIEAYDKQGPAINSFTNINEEAIEIAKQLDAERQSKGKRSVLHGIPIVVKDNFDVKGMPTTAGSVALKDAYPVKDAFAIRKLKDAGAIIIGKTNMSEFAASYGRLGYSSLGGLTLNPYNLKRDASGSSSGTAAAITANFGVFGLGTDTSGSVRGPSHVTGLVAIRPTLGLISRGGIVPSSLNFDTAGPMARSVEDVAIALSFMAGVDDKDDQTLSAKGHIVEDYSKSLDNTALQNARIGVAVDFFGDNAEVDTITNKSLKKMEEIGTELIPVSFSETTQYLWTPIIGPINEANFKSQLEEYLKQFPESQPKTLEEIIKISESPEVLNSATPVNPAGLEGLKTNLKQAAFKDTPEYNDLVTKEISKVRDEVQSIMEKENLDAIVFPTMSCPASPRFDKEDPTYLCDAYDTYAASYVASATGFPEITVPAGATGEELPVGISFMGLAFSEQSLLDIAYSFEQATNARTLPKTTPNFEMNADEKPAFKDVSSYVDEIMYLTDKGIINGYPDGTFKPNESITRLHAIRLILKEKGIVDYSDVTNPEFVDVSPGDYGYEEIAKAVELGIVNGKVNSQGEKYFDPTGKLSRSQAAAILVLAYDLKGTHPTDFKDVPKGNWAHNYISALVANNITTGYSNGKFKPNINISRQHFAAFMARYLDDQFKPTK
ncbi:amidase family protein [Sporosarcina aquimarina]|uniref:amidase family protein n=1 Tax=Sporosarcina aquimarina TaxID=114975 RepID=UPI001C8D0CBD|nr:amidase family protein [Sporosarcina aquimarina]MBY0223385.1 S-layer homology domain-containing protein [Sporosarcina aquimarina]